MPTAMPTSSTTDDVVLPTGSQRLGIASSEMAVTTAVPASSSGMPAAISAPNTHSSSTSVIGTEVTSARRKSELMMLLVARSTLAWPDSATRRPGWAAWTAATARSAATTVWSALFGLPATLNVTSADRPSREISLPPPGASGDSMPVATLGMAPSAAVTCLMARRISGSPATVRVPLRAWIRTVSVAGWTTPGRLSTRSA